MESIATCDTDRMDVVDWMDSLQGQPDHALRSLDREPRCSTCGSPMDEGVMPDGRAFCIACIDIEPLSLAA